MVVAHIHGDGSVFGVEILDVELPVHGGGFYSKAATLVDRHQVNPDITYNERALYDVRRKND